MDDGRVRARRVNRFQTMMQMVVPAVGHWRARFSRLARPDRWVDRWIAFCVMGFVLVVPLAGWTMHRRAWHPPSTRHEISFERAPSATPTALTASFVIEPIIAPPPAQTNNPSPLANAIRTKKRAPPKPQWVASLSHSTWRRHSPTPAHGPRP